MELFERWSEAFPKWAWALSQGAPVVVTESHLPFLREDAMWPQVTALVGLLINTSPELTPDSPQRAEAAAARADALERVLDVFAPVCTEGGQPPLRRRLGTLDLAQRRAVSALMDALTTADWITRPWQESAQIDHDDWLAHVTAADEGRLVWWWRKARSIESDGLEATPVMTSFRRDLSDVARRIEAAFDGVPPPERVTLAHAQRSALSDEAHATRESHRGRWQDIPVAELQACPQALSYLDDDGLHYYVPRVMLECLCWHECSNRELLSICDHLWVRVEHRGFGTLTERLTTEQVEACTAFVEAWDWPTSPDAA